MKNTKVGKKGTLLFQFINHKKRKNKKENYLVARLQSLEYKSKIFNVPVEFLENYMKVGV